MLTFHLEKSIKIYQQKGRMECVKVKLLKSKVWWEWFWNIYQVNEINQRHTNHRMAYQDLFLALLVRGNTQGKLLLSARLVLFSDALM